MHGKIEFAKVHNTIEDYITQHNHINYCEILIYPDGRCSELTSSHTNNLVEWIWGVKHHHMELDEAVKFNKRFEKITNLYHYLTNQSGLISVWYSQAVIPLNYTDIQMESLNTLIHAVDRRGRKILDFTSDDHRICIGRVNWPSGIIMATES